MNPIVAAGFGFFESTFSGIERSRDYNISVGFISGVIPSSSFSVDVNFEHVTTSESLANVLCCVKYTMLPVFVQRILMWRSTQIGWTLMVQWTS